MRRELFGIRDISIIRGRLLYCPMTGVACLIPAEDNVAPWEKYTDGHMTLQERLPTLQI